MATVIFRMRSWQPAVPAIRYPWETVCVDAYRPPLWDGDDNWIPTLLTYGDAVTAAKLTRRYQVALAAPPRRQRSAATVFMRATKETQLVTSVLTQLPPPSNRGALPESPISLEEPAASASRRALCNRQIAARVARTRPPNTLDRTGGAVLGRMFGLRDAPGSDLGEETPITTRYSSVEAYFDVGIPIPEYTPVWYVDVNFTPPSRPWPLDWPDDWGR